MNPPAQRTFPPEHDGTTSVTDDGRAVLRFERILRHPVDRVWSAVTDPERMTAWLAYRVEIEPHVDGRLKLWLGDSRATEPVQTGSIRVFDPPHVLEAAFEDGSVLRFELRAADSPLETTLVFTDTRPAGVRAQRSVLAGWHLRMDQLPDHLDGHDTDWLALDNDRDPNGFVAAIAEIYWHYHGQGDRA